MCSQRATADVRVAATPVVDVHAHFFPSGMPDFGAQNGDPRWPTLRIDSADSGRIMLGDVTFRLVRSSLWDVGRRLTELDGCGVAAQVISPVPVMLVTGGDPADALRFARDCNDGIASAVGSSGGRLIGLGTVPLQNVSVGIKELRRAVNVLGLRGVEIGTRVNGRELDDPDLLPFFRAAAELDVAVLVHPVEGGGGAIRRTGQPYDFGLGMLTDTAMAAGALVFGGVLDACDGLRVGLSHGCGTYPWALPRLIKAMELTAHDGRDFAALTRRLWVDALVFDPQQLRVLVATFGASHVMLGTDHPFVPGMLKQAPALIRDAVAVGALQAEDLPGVLGRNAYDFVHSDPVL